jgi:flagellar biosynthetic protein FlhB
VARGLDLGFFGALAAFAGFAWVSGRGFASGLALSMERALVAAPNVLASPNELLSITAAALVSQLQPVAFLAATVFLAVLVVEVVQIGGPVFSGEPLRPDFARLNPARGFRRVFSFRMLIETAKNVVKLAVYVALSFAVIRGAWTADVGAVNDAVSLAERLQVLALRLLLVLLAAAAAFAVLDQIIIRRDFLSKMRMSRREIRRELRDREGEPRVKQRRRKLHREFAKLSQSVRNVRDADVLITNPTHFAVALKYDAKTMTAPRVVSQGSHQIAVRLRRLAFLYGVTIVEDKALAQALFHKCELNRPIPDAYYRPVANVYISIRDARRRRVARHA